MDSDYHLIEVWEGGTIKLVGGSVGKMFVVEVKVDKEGRVTIDAGADLTWQDENILGWEHAHVDERYVAELAAFNEAYRLREEAEWEAERRQIKIEREARKQAKARQERRKMRRQAARAARAAIERARRPERVAA